MSNLISCSVDEYVINVSVNVNINMNIENQLTFKVCGFHVKQPR